MNHREYGSSARGLEVVHDVRKPSQWSQSDVVERERVVRGVALNRREYDSDRTKELVTKALAPGFVPLKGGTQFLLRLAPKE